jgi:rRNA maturation protein Nop10
MDDNRFMRVYQEYKKEQEQERYAIDDRFSKLREREPNRFDCLIDDNYNRYRTTQRNYYEPRIPKESVNERARRHREEKANAQPEFSLKSEYHFPELVQTRTDMKPTLKKEMIVNEIEVHLGTPVMTSIGLKDGKFIQNDIYRNGIVVEDGAVPVIIKKPVYSSWSSVVKSHT